MNIDSHQHFWRLGAFDYPWLSPSLGLLYRDYLPADLRPLLGQAGIDKTIVVQASPSLEETHWLLALARDNPFIAGVVGWLDLESPDFADQLVRLGRNPLLVGLRPAVEFIDDDRWLLRPKVLKSLGIMAEAGVPLDLIVWPRHLEAVVELVERLPRLRCVIDHLAKPGVRRREMEPWRTWIAKVAGHANVWCKLSGLMTCADPAGWTTSDLQPYFDHVIQAFGPDRLMYGSDWPVSLLASDYATTARVVREALGGVDADAADAVFGHNAGRFYKLPAAVMA
jgi:L-fuconolactonase